MRLSTAIALAASATTAHAFKDTSPFLLFSSSPLPSSVTSFSTDQLQSASDVLQSTSEFLSTCPTHLYLIVSQPQVAASDLAPRTSIPFLRRSIADSSVETRNLISEVVSFDEALAGKQLLETVVAKCDAELYESEKFLSGQWDPLKKDKKIVVMTSFDALPTEKLQRERQLADNDAALHKFVELLPKESYTVIYTTSPVAGVIEESKTYDPVFQEAFHMDLKRDITGSKKTNSTRDPRPLFEKYNFFSPGLFMGLVTSFILLSILSVGLKALGSLQVSYGAFDKEMGPAAQKKQ